MDRCPRQGPAPKALIIDRRVTIMGTYNWSKVAGYQQRRFERCIVGSRRDNAKHWQGPAGGVIIDFVLKMAEQEVRQIERQQSRVNSLRTNFVAVGAAMIAAIAAIIAAVLRNQLVPRQHSG
jgi:hypothetical protein